MYYLNDAYYNTGWGTAILGSEEGLTLAQSGTAFNKVTITRIYYNQNSIIQLNNGIIILNKNGYYDISVCIIGSTNSNCTNSIAIRAYCTTTSEGKTLDLIAYNSSFCARGPVHIGQYFGSNYNIEIDVTPRTYAVTRAYIEVYLWYHAN